MLLEFFSSSSLELSSDPDDSLPLSDVVNSEDDEDSRSACFSDCREAEPRFLLTASEGGLDVDSSLPGKGKGI